MNHNTEVAIVGAGPTGLMMAGLLARCGIRVRIFDKREQHSVETRAFAIQAKSMELFLNMGIAENFLNQGLFANGAQIFVNGQQKAQLNFDDIGRNDTPYSFLLMLPQSDIEAILIQDLKNYDIQIERMIEINDFEQTDNGVKVYGKNLLDKENFNFSCLYLIGADGAHSIVRKKLGLTFSGAMYPASFFLADCKVDWPHDYEHMKVFLRKNHMAAFLPLKGKDFSRIIVIKSNNPITEDKISETNSSLPVNLDEIQSAFNQATGNNYLLSHPIWLSNYRIHHRAVNAYSRGSVFIAGDAAHIHSPAGGQGMNTGLQDAANLAWKIALVLRAGTAKKLLATYNLERWPVGQKILHYTDKLFSGMSSQKPFYTWLRNHIVPVVAKIISHNKSCRKKAFSFISQLGIRYHKNDFLYDYVNNTNKAWLTGLTPGHRAPNARINQTLDLFSLMQGYCFNLLILSKKPLATDEIEELDQDLNQLNISLGIKIKKHLIAYSLVGRNEKIIQSECNEIFSVYGLNKKILQAMFLVRPDGYIAYRADKIDFKDLVGFLGRFEITA